MLFILLHMKLLNMLWEETRLVFIILLLLVCFRECQILSILTDNGIIATSGACATIASDALMNPFDGMIDIMDLLEVNLLTFSSYQAAHANA